MTLPNTFAALGNETRLAIVERLLEHGELPAGSLQDIGKVSAPALSRHFKILKDVGLLEQRIDKQRRLYSVRPEALKAISEWSMTYREFWDASFDRLAAALDKYGEA